MTRYLDIIFPKKSNFSIETETYSESPFLEMDIYRALSDTDRNRAAVVWLHGGGASKDDVGWMYQKRGYVVCAIDYRNSKDDVGFTDEEQLLAASDGMAAVRYVKANATRLGINPNWIIPVGTSAGGITVIHGNIYQANPSNPYFSAPGMNHSTPEFPMSILASVCSSGAANRKFQSLIKAGVAPQIMETGNKDTTVPYAEQVLTFNLLKAVQPLCTQKIYDAGHAIGHQTEQIADIFPKLQALIK